MTKQAGAQRVAAGYTATGGAFAAAAAFEALVASRLGNLQTAEAGPPNIPS